MTLHVYGQKRWHDPVKIYGTWQGLIALRAALDKAITEGEGKCDARTGDGEGYKITVHQQTTVDMGRMVLPYTDPMTRGES